MSSANTDRNSGYLDRELCSKTRDVERFAEVLIREFEDVDVSDIGSIPGNGVSNSIDYGATSYNRELSESTVHPVYARDSQDRENPLEYIIENYVAEGEELVLAETYLEGKFGGSHDSNLIASLKLCAEKSGDGVEEYLKLDDWNMSLDNNDTEQAVKDFERSLKNLVEGSHYGIRRITEGSESDLHGSNVPETDWNYMLAD